MQALANYRFFGAPHLAVITTHASLGVRSLVDVGAYVAVFLLAAEAMRVAAVAQASIAYRADVIRGQLKLNPDRHVVCGISFGRCNESHPANSYRTTRARVEDIVEFRE